MQARFLRLGLMLLLSLSLAAADVFDSSLVTNTQAQAAPLNCDLTLGAWKIVNPAPYFHVEGATAVVNNKLYLFGGFDSSTATASNRVDVFNLASNRWETASVPLRPMPFIASHLIAVVDGQYIWFAGGFIGNNPGVATNAVWKYDSLMDLWYPAPPLPAPRAGGAFARNGRTLHYFGGTTTDRNSDMSDHWTLNLDDPSATWQAAPSMPDARNHVMVAAVNNRLYVMGGQFRHDYRPIDTNLMHVFNPVTNQWAAAANLAQPRSHFEPGTLVYGGRVVVVGGRNNQSGLSNTSLKNISEYNPLTNTWREIGQLPWALFAPSAAMIGDTLVVTVGGYAYNHPQKTTYTSKVTLSNCVDPNPTLTPSPTLTATSTPTNTAEPTHTPTDSPTAAATATDPIPETPIDTPTDVPTTTPSPLPTVAVDRSRIVGDFSLSGSGLACNEANLDAALALGGSITFDCPNPTTITLTSEKPISAVDVTLDGGTLGAITLSGGGTTRLFRVEGSRTLTLQQVRLVNGYATDNGGAILSSNGRVHIMNSLFEANRVIGNGRSGGAIFITGTSARLNIIQTTFNGNSANGDSTNLGGAIVVTGGGQANLANSTFVNNSTTGYGGALRISDTRSAVNITHTTFSGNNALGSSAINRSNGVITLRNSVMANRLGGVYCGTTITDGGGNVIHGSSCAGITPVSNANPLLGALTGNPPYLPLTAGSSALDRATNCTYLSTADNPLFAAGAPVFIDQSGAPRPSGAACDSGAIEFSTTTLLMLPQDTVTPKLTLSDGLSWEAVPNATAYKLVIHYLNKAGNPKRHSQPLTTELCDTDGMCTLPLSAVEMKLKAGRVYQWRVVAITPDGKQRSPRQSFTIQPPTEQASGDADMDIIPLPLPPTG